MNYHILDSLDLRAFDNREKDYGVHNYLETLGFVPDPSFFRCVLSSQ